MSRLLLPLILACSTPLLAQAPRYQFGLGDKLSFAGSSDAKASYGTTWTGVRWTFWVVRKNPDGSHRLVFRKSTKTKREMKTGKKYDYPEAHRNGWIDLDPSGRFAANDSVALGTDPSIVFPPLPKAGGAVDAAAGKPPAFIAEIPIFDRQYHGKAGSDAGHSFNYRVTSPSHRNYEQDERIELHLDPETGLPKTVTQTIQRKGSSSELRLSFKGKGEVDGTWARDFAVQAQAFFAAKRAYEQTTNKGRTHAAQVDALLAKAHADLQAAAGQAKLPEVQALYKEVLDKHGNREKYVRTYAERFATVMNQPSADWACQNLKGEDRKLADYQGKVVILDFWYRGCGWCVRAMPQMNALFDHYKDQPVAILGVNKDKKLADAEHTVQAVGLRYENLHSLDMPALYQVRGYPTLVVLDKKGVVRDIHVGYSPHLKTELIEIIDGLLAE